LFQEIPLEAACAENESELVSDFEDYGARKTFTTPINGVEFITNINILTGFVRENGYFHFMKISQERNLQSLPAITNMVVDASIVSNSGSYNLLIDYKAIGVKEYLSIPLSDLNFELTISWVNLGCLNGVVGNCVEGKGQIEVKINYDNTEIIQTIDALPYEANSVYWKVSGVYWGELGRDNFSGEVELQLPAGYLHPWE